MREINTNEINAISGANYLSSMLGAFGNGMTDGEKSFLVTGMGVGFVVGSFVGRWSMMLGLVSVGGYAAWDWFSGSSEASEG